MFQGPGVSVLLRQGVAGSQDHGGGANLPPPDAECPAVDRYGGSGKGGTVLNQRPEGVRVRARSVRRDKRDGGADAVGCWLGNGQWTAWWELGSREGTATRSPGAGRKAFAIAADPEEPSTGSFGVGTADGTTRTFGETTNEGAPSDYEGAAVGEATHEGAASDNAASGENGDELGARTIRVRATFKADVVSEAASPLSAAAGYDTPGSYAGEKRGSGK